MSTSAYNQTGVDLPDPEPVAPPAPREPSFDVQSWYDQVREELPENFKDPRGFVDSYKNLERRLTDLSREKQEAEEYAQAMAEQMELQEQRQQQAQPSLGVENNPLLQQWQAAYDPYEGDAQQQLALTAFVASQLYDQKMAEQQTVPDEAAQAQASIFARVVDQDVQQAYEQKYNEPWSQMRTQVGDFLAENMHWLEGVTTPEQAAHRINQAADFIRTQADQPEQAGNPQRTNAQKFLGQTLQGHGARTQASQDAASELVERMKGLARPYGYNT